MASKISKKKTLKIKAVLGVDGNSKQITLEVEDIDTPLNLADLAMEFNGEEVDISFSLSEDIA